MRGYRLIGRGLTPSAGPAVRRDYGDTALMQAANIDDRAFVAALLGARADVNTQNTGGCAVCRRRCPARWSAVVDGDADAAAPAPSGRWTALHYAAHY